MMSQFLYTWLALNNLPTGIATTSWLSNQSTILFMCYVNKNDMYECVQPGSIKTHASILSIDKKPEITPGSY